MTDQDRIAALEATARVHSRMLSAIMQTQLRREANAIETWGPLLREATEGAPTAALELLEPILQAIPKRWR